MPSWAPYHALISNHPSPFSCLFKTPLTTCLLLHFLFFTPIFWLSYPLVSLAAAPWLSTSFWPPHCPPTRVMCWPQPHNSPHLCHSAQSNRSSFCHSSFSFHHSSFPFILSFLSLPCLSHAAFQASPSGHPSCHWPLSCSPHVFFKHHPTTILHVTSTTPAAPKAIRPAPCRLCHPPSLALHHHPCLEWATNDPHYWHGGLLGCLCLLIFLPCISTFPTIWLESSPLPLLYSTYPLIHSSPTL